MLRVCCDAISTSNLRVLDGSVGEERGQWRGDGLNQSETVTRVHRGQPILLAPARESAAQLISVLGRSLELQRDFL